MIEFLALALIAGILSKLVDLAEEHGLRFHPRASNIAGIAYGAILAYLISFSPELSSLCLAVIIAVLVSGKIDTLGHGLAMLSALILVPIFGLPQIALLQLIVFVLAGVADEIISDRLAGRKSLASRLMSLRPILEVSAFAISMIYWQWIIWFGLLLYDIGYASISRAMGGRTRILNADNVRK